MFLIKGKIYEIRDFETGNFYIGSTVLDLDERLNKHKRDYKKYLNDKEIFMSSFEILKNNNYDIYLLENFFCNSIRELQKREGKWQKILKPFGCVNINIAGRNKKEYYEDNKEYYIKYRENNMEKRKEYEKEYAEKNKDKVKEYQKEYYRNNKDYFIFYHTKYFNDNKELILKKNKEYYENNKDLMKEKHKQYREKNKDIIKEKRKEKIICECGSEILKYGIAEHKRTKKHIRLMEEKNKNKEIIKIL